MPDRDIEQRGGDDAAERQIVGGPRVRDLFLLAGDGRALAALALLELRQSLINAGEVDRRGSGS